MPTNPPLPPGDPRHPDRLPIAASPFMSARCLYAAWAAAMFASEHFHACSAACCNARPYEKDSRHGCGPLALIALRLAVASSTVAPGLATLSPGQ